MNWLGVQIVAAGLVALGLPFGLVLFTSQRPWLLRAARTIERRRTTVLLVGAATFLALFALVLVCERVRAEPLRNLLVFVAVVLFTAGFAPHAWTQGRALLGRDEGASPMVWGWLARAGLLAVPLVGACFGAYLVALSLGAPLVAWFAPASNDTIDPSSGSTPPK